MRSVVHVTAAAVLLAIGGSACGQALQKLERQLTPAAGGADAAPGSGYLGMVPYETDEGGRGVRVSKVTKGSPAETAGLKAEDLISAVDGRPLSNLAAFDAILERATVGQPMRLTVERAGRREILAVTLGVRPSAAAATPAEPATSDPPSAAPPRPAPATPMVDPALPPTRPALPTEPATPPPAIGSPALGSPAPSSPAPSAPALGTPGPGLPPLTTPFSSPAIGTPAAPDPATPAPPEPIRSRPTEPAPGAPPPVSGISPETSPPPAGVRGGASLGISVVPLTEAAAAGVPVSRGALITSVRRGSPAELAGLPVGGVVVRIDTQRVDSADDLIAAIRAARPGQEVELTYYDGGSLSRKAVRLAPAATTAAPGTAPRETAEPPPARGYGRTGDPSLLGQVEREAGNLQMPRGASTVYNPLEVAAIQTRLVELAGQVKTLEDRLRSIEARLTAPPPAPGLGGTNP